MRFVNDPSFDELVPVGGGAEPVVVARRTLAGVAFRWVPGGDAEALVRVMGGNLVAVAGRVFQPVPDGSLQPVDVSRPFVVVVPPAGDPFTVDPVEFRSQWAVAVADVVLPAVSSVPSAEVTVVPVVSGAGAAEGEGEGDRAVSEVADAAPEPVVEKSVPVKRGPGRPRKVVADGEG